MTKIDPEKLIEIGGKVYTYLGEVDKNYKAYGEGKAILKGQERETENPRLGVKRTATQAGFDSQSMNIQEYYSGTFIDDLPEGICKCLTIFAHNSFRHFLYSRSHGRRRVSRR